MRIGLGVAKAIGGQGDTTGIGVYTRNLWEQLGRRSDVCVTPVDGFGNRAAVDSARESFSFPWRYGPSAAMTTLTGCSFPGARRLHERIDVYHATDYWIPRLRGTPVVATLHDAIAVSHPEWAPPRHRWVKNALLKSSARWADAVVTVSAAMVPEIVEYFGVSADRISVVHNGISSEWLDRVDSRQSAATLQRHGLESGYVLTVGTLQPRKNLGRLLKAHAAMSPEYKRLHPLLVVGSQGWVSDEEMEMLVAAAARRQAIWLQHVPEADLKAIYQNACALAVPSLYEGFGLPLIEGFASAIPVLTSDAASLSEISGGAALLVDPLDVEAIADGLKRIVADPGLRKELVERGNKRIHDFSWQRCAAQTIDVYRKVF